MTGGFFKIQRKFFLHPLWQEDRTYSRAEAFLDLLQLAAFAPCRRLSAGVMVELSVGQLIGSERYLAGRWNWSTKKVRAYFQMIVSEKMAVIEKKREGSIITLCNYARYANMEIEEEAPKKRRGSAEEAPRKRIEEVKELEEGKELITPLPPKGDDEGDRILPKNWKKIGIPDQKSTKVLKNSRSMIQIGSWFDRQPDTLWSIYEAGRLLKISPSQAEIDGMGIYYTQGRGQEKVWLRADLPTLLNNWSGELDRARAFINSQSQ